MKGIFGDWDKAISGLAKGAKTFNKIMQEALLEEGHFYRKKIIEGFDSGAPGGKAFAPHSPLTEATRKADGKGSKILIRNGDLRNSIAVKMFGQTVFVGVLKSARNKSGKSMVDVAELHEFGSHTVTVPWTKASRGKFFSILRKSGTYSKALQGGGGGTFVFRIPPRPFLRPVFDLYGRPEVSKRRFMDRVKTKLQKSTGLPFSG